MRNTTPRSETTFNASRAEDPITVYAFTIAPGLPATGRLPVRRASSVRLVKRSAKPSAASQISVHDGSQGWSKRRR